MSRTIRSLEGGRGLAALLVALYHLQIGAQEFSLLRNGYLFVDLFFVLSGFVMAGAYESRLGDVDEVRRFVIRRMGRLWPLLIFSTLAFVLIENALVLAKRLAASAGYGGMLANPDALAFSVPDPLQLLAVATFTHALNLFDGLILNTPSWSISAEFFTYLLFALTALTLRGALRTFAYWALIIAGFTLSVWASVEVHGCMQQKGCLSLTWDYAFPRAAFSFFMGALCRRSVPASVGVRIALQMLGVGIVAILLARVDEWPLLAFGFPFAFAMLILGCAQDDGPLASLLTNRPLQILGERSYSIYLMHMPLLLVFENLARRAQSLPMRLLVVLAFVGVLIWVSGWTYRRVEAPARDWFNRFAARPAHAGAQSGIAKDSLP